MDKKKGKKSGGKKKGGKKKKNEEPEMSWQEALLAYKIHIMQQQIEDVRIEFKAVEEKNLRNKERNERLQAEQVLFIQELIKQAKDFERQLAEEEVVDKDAVVSAMKDKWETIRQEENEVAVLKEKIARTEAAYILEQREVEKWQDYKKVGIRQDETQIDLLRQELSDMQSNYQEMAAHLERTMSKAKQEIEKHTQESVDKQKYLATENAMARMDKDSRQEVLDNDWLQQEVAIHQREVDELLRQVDQLEKENLAIMSELFECSVDDLKISRKFFLTQFQEGDNLDGEGILEIDLAQISIDQREKSGQKVKPRRPKSGTAQFIEDKVFSLPVAARQDAEEETDSDDASHYDGYHGEDEEDDVFNNYFNIDDEDFEEYLQLGPLELKLLSIQGKKMPIHVREQAANVSDEEGETTQQDLPTEWALTRRQTVTKVLK